EDVGDPGEHQRLVVADDDARGLSHHASVTGIAASTTVPPPDGLSTVRCPSRAVTRSPRPASPPPGRATAPPMPSSSTVSRSRPSSWRALTRAPEAFAYFATLVSASAATK